VTPDKVVEVQALIGDATDNVPGVRGIGPKGAAELINEYGTLEAVLEAAPGMKPSKRRESLIEQAEAARISRELVLLRDDAPLPEPLDALALRAWDKDVLRSFLAENNFRSIRTRLGLDGTEEIVEAPPAEIGFGPYALGNVADVLAQARESGVVAVCVLPGLGLGLATAAGRAVYVPGFAGLAELLAAPGVLKIFHDAKAALGILGEVAPFDDVMLISYALDAGNFAHDLVTLARVHLSHTAKEMDHVTGSGRGRVDLFEAPTERAAEYAAEAADITLRLWALLKPRLRGAKLLALYELLEKPLVPVLLAMERAGVLVDRADLAAMSAEFEQRMAAIEKDIHALAGREFNVGSPKQLGEVLFDEMKLAGGKKGKTGAYGTDASILEELAESGAEIAQRVLDWRQLAKLKSTYADALVEQADAGGRVHTRFQMAVAATGRLSSTDPNLQNIPVRTAEGARIRKAFVAPEGFALVSADYSQIELRLLAHVADIPALKESFARGEDIHARTASEVFGVPMAGMDALTRRRAKAINFGIIYGISAFGLARQLGVAPGEARTYIEAYFARYPEIRAYMEGAKEFARAHGYVLTPFGRRIWVPKIKDKIPSLRAYAERAAINAPLQGGGADVIKMAMIKLPKALQEAGLSARMLLQVHDELLLEAPEAEAAATAALMQKVMQGAASLSVPLMVETGVGKNWGEAH
jgi:DNA polymerase-1